MNQLRSADLFRYKQYFSEQNRNFQQHKQKVKSIMNRSTQSIQKLSQKQRMILTKNNLSHQKALKFKFAEKQRQINFVNNNFINRIYSNDKKRTKLFQKQINTSRSQIFRAQSHLIKSPAKLSTSRTTVVQKDNSFIKKRINQMKSTISLKDFNKDYNKHTERSSSLSKFKIDARSFKFIPKNQILLEKINKVKGSLQTSRSVRESKVANSSGFITQRVPATFKQASKIKPKTSQPLIKLSLPVKPAQKTVVKNVKLQQLKINEKKLQPVKFSTVMRLSNPQTSSSVRKIKFNNF